ncbi:hypothetical protein V5O48_001643 [Marasmius crinis-equi]|uniref:Uncharacterized protein n=1 Tax=Marasmius crinis-equi TaxID=585013 RepID=A0ABR3FXX9_9AGAR
MSMQRLEASKDGQEASVLSDDKDDRALPGAWPITPMHKRTHTYPLQPQERAMHPQRRKAVPLGCAGQRQTGLPESLSSSEGFGPSSSDGVPSDDSNLTRFTPSHSAFAVQSVASSSSTIALSPVAPRKCQIPAMDDESESEMASLELQKRIQRPLPSTPSPPRVRVLDSPPARRSSVRTPASRSIRASLAAVTPSSSSPPSQLTPSQSSVSSFQPSLSPMVFTSPTSSNGPRRATDNHFHDSYDYNSSWKSSGDDSTFNNSDFRVGTPSPTPSPSPSPLSAHNNRHWEAPTVSVTSPSVDELPLPPQTMLTSLSLPGSLNEDDSFSLNIPIPFERLPSFSSANRSDSETPGTLSVPLTPTSDLSDLITSPTNSTSPSVSLFSGTDFQESPSRTHVIRLPPPSTSITPGSTALADRRESFNATDYAHAVVMSSSWGNDAGIDPLVSPNAENSVIPDPDASVSGDLSVSRSPVRSRRSVTFAEQTQTQEIPRLRNGVFVRVKKLGSRFKRFVLGTTTKPKPPRHQYVLRRCVAVQAETSQPDQQVLDIGAANSTVGSQILPRLELELGGGELAGALASRTRRLRPSLTPDTYTPQVTDGQLPRTSNVSGGQNVGATATAPEGSTSPPFEFQDQLAEHARPKTVEEIKAKRPFSISALPNLAGSSSNINKPSPKQQRRTSRPVSDLVMTRDSYRQGLHRGYSSSHVVLPAPSNRERRYSLIPHPPGLEMLSPSEEHDRRASGPTVMKETRRFSLSALSSFAAGLRQQGTWARYSGSDSGSGRRGL